MGLFVNLVMVSLASFECNVPNPECPVFNAVNNVIASSALTSPTIILSGRCLSEFLTRSFIVNSPLFSTFAGLVSILITCSWGICSSNVSSMVIILSDGLMKAERALSVVVFPELVPPDMIALADLTPNPSKHNQKNAASSMDIVFEFIKSIIVKGSFLNFRIVSDGPSAEIGGIVAFSIF